VTTFAGVIRATCEDGAKPKWNVSAVDVLHRNDTGATVERAGGEDAVRERLSQTGVSREQGVEMVRIFLINLWRVKGERVCGSR